MLFILPCLFALSWASVEFHKKLETSDLVHYFGTSLQHQVPPYQLLSSTNITKISNHTDVYQQYLFQVFDTHYHLYLYPYSQLVSPACIIQHIGANRSHYLEPCNTEETFCHYHGYVKGDNLSSAAVNTCNGLNGIISTGDHDLIVQPIKKEHVRLVNHAEDSHIVYKRSARKTACSQTEGHPDIGQLKSSDEGSKGQPLESNQSNHRNKRSAGQYVEIKAVVAPDAYRYHRGDTQRFVTTVLNVAAQRFQHSSLGYKLYLTLVEIMILRDDQSDFTVVRETPKLLNDFCQWQQKHHPTLDSNPRHADHVLLITRMDLADNGDDSNVGLAYTGQICSKNHQCSVNEDTGIQTGLTIAHEIGHSLGMSHDGEGNQCPASRYIMSANSAGRLQWSPCSAKYLEDFIRSSKSSCLTDTPAGVATNLYSIRQKPGFYYSYTKQCQLARNDPDSVPCDNQVNCGEIRCHSGGNCYVLGQPLIDGTECGSRKWCLEGKCVAMGSGSPGPINGGWSSWSDQWTPCSRSCGGGVKVRTRKCEDPEPRYGGRDCPGEGIMAVLCNVQECSISQYKFKEEQCSATNSEPYGGQFLTWLPITSASDHYACQLMCRYPGGNTGVLRGSHRYQDGTSCSSRSHVGRCISGKCEDFGCDGHHRSGLVFDKCGVCNGRGNTCRDHRGSYNQGVANRYVTFVRIPRGATGIEITNRNQYCHITISVNGKRLFSQNGNQPSLSSTYSRYGVIVEYRKQHGQAAEKIDIAGPLPTEIEAQVWRDYDSHHFGTNPQISYIYSTPIPGARADYRWTKRPGPCSQTCGGGKAYSEITCVQSSNNRPVDDLYCNLYSKPQETPEGCNNSPCPPQWFAEDWGTCSRSCGGGIAHRAVQCSILQHGRHTPVSDSHCNSWSKPETSQSCNISPCPAVWKAEKWSCCSRSCSMGVRRRTVRCYQSQDSTQPVSDDKCLASQKPAEVDTCMEKPCETSKGGSSCRDKEDCSTYSTTVCTNPQYEGVASTNCQEYCGYCVKDPQEFKPPGDCEDTEPDCAAYGADVCTNYAGWSKQNCQKTCNLCPREACQPYTEPAPPVSDDCVDKITDCADYGDDTCQTYKEWAGQNCKKFCKLCTAAATTTTTTTTTLPPASDGCVDKLADCADYGADMCQNYGPWAKQNCQKFCNFCPVTTTPLPPASDGCVDKISDCADYGADMCQNYGPWAKQNCQKYCNFCPGDTCKDKDSDCADYGKSACTGYKEWAKAHCQSYCGLCGARKKRSILPLMNGKPVPIPIHGDPIRAEKNILSKKNDEIPSKIYKAPPKLTSEELSDLADLHKSKTLESVISPDLHDSEPLIKDKFVNKNRNNDVLEKSVEQSMGQTKSENHGSIIKTMIKDLRTFVANHDSDSAGNIDIRNGLVEPPKKREMMDIPVKVVPPLLSQSETRTVINKGDNLVVKSSIKEEGPKWEVVPDIDAIPLEVVSVGEDEVISETGDDKVEDSIKGKDELDEELANLVK